MRFFTSNFKWLMLAAGLLTCTMFQALIFPEASIQSNFGQSPDGHLFELIVRNWGALIGLEGVMLIYGAFVESVRRFVLVMAGTSKIVFIILVLTAQESYLRFGAGTAIIVDSILVTLFVIYLLATRHRNEVKG